MYLVSLLHSPFVSVSSSYYYDCGLNLGVVRAKKKTSVKEVVFFKLQLSQLV